MNKKVQKEIRFFGRRKGKAIKPSRERLMEELLPRLTPVLPESGKMFDFNTLFGVLPTEVWLEVGFGGGEHLAAQSLAHPDVGFIGAEPFLNGVSSLLAHLNGSHENAPQHAGLDEKRTDNVRIWPDDVRMLFPFIPDGSFKRIFVLYPDPWPKSRHAERRFINQFNLKHLYRLLADDGELRVATDVADYVDWTLEQVAISDLFTQINADISRAPADWVPTRYEQKGIRAGRKPAYLILKKKIKNT